MEAATKSELKKAPRKRRKALSTHKKAAPKQKRHVMGKPKKESKKEIHRQPVIVYGLLFLFFFAFLFRYNSHRVDGESMSPALANNDRIFSLKTKAPKRYEVITFRPKDKPKQSYVKRVIGMPGDAIWMDNNTLYINHQLVNNSEQPLNNSDFLGRKLPDGTIKVWLSKEQIQAFIDKRTIPENHYFVLGDNRNHSADSRAFGLVEASQIEGVVKWRYYPLNKVGTVN